MNEIKLFLINVSVFSFSTFMFTTNLALIVDDDISKNYNRWLLPFGVGRVFNFYFSVLTKKANNILATNIQLIMPRGWHFVVKIIVHICMQNRLIFILIFN